MNKPLIYLASPYSGTYAQKIDRFETICWAARQFMLAGNHIFCPIAHSHPIEESSPEVMGDGDFWLEQDFAVLKHCQQLWVYMMNGWKESYGVGKEIEFANAHKIPVVYVEPI